MPFKKNYKDIAYSIWHVTVYVTIFFALLFSLLRFITPMLQNYRPQIAAYVSDYLDKDVTIDEIEASWQGFGPSIILNNVKVHGEQDESSAVVDKMQLRFSLWRSLISWQWLPDKFQVQGMRANIILEETEKEELDTVSLETLTKEKLIKVLSILNKFPETDIQESYVNIQYEGDKYQLKHINVYYYLDGGVHYFNADAYAGSNMPAHFRLHANITGDINDLEHLSGKSYLEVKRLSVDLLKELMPNSLDHILSGAIQLNQWLAFSHGKIQSAQTKFKIDELSYQLKDKDEPIVVSVGANTLWQQQSDSGWLLTGDNLTIQSGDYQVPQNQFRLEKKTENAQSIYSLQTSSLQLPGLLQLMANFSQDDKARALLAKTTLQGQMNNLLLRVTKTPDDAWYYVFNAKLSEVGVANVEGVPELENISGVVEASSKTGSLIIDSQDVSLKFAKAKDKLLFASVKAGFSWQAVANGWQIEARNIHLANDDMNLTANLGFMLDENKKLHANVYANIPSLSLKKLPNYLPRHVFSSHLNEWLDMALVKGTLNNTTVKLVGPLDKLPYENEEQGVFLVTGTLDESTLKYTKGWPEIENVTADIFYDGKHLWSDFKKGTLSGTTLETGKVVFTDLMREGHTEFTLDAKVNGTFKQATNFVNNSKLKDTLGRKLKVLTLDGPMDISFHYRDVIEKHNLSKLRGLIQTPGATITIPSQELVFNQVVGKTEFDNHGIYSKQLSANFWGEPATAIIDTKVKEDNKTTLTVELSSEISPEKLNEKFPNRLWHHVKGKAPYKATFIDNSDEKGSRLEVRSDLKGFALNMPEPFKLASEKTIPFAIDFYWPGDETMQTTLSYGKKASANLNSFKKNDHWRFERGMAFVGSGKYPKLPKAKGISINGSIAFFDYNNWHLFVDDLQKNSDGPAFIDWQKDLNRAKVSIAKLLVLDQTLANVSTTVSSTKSAWHVNLNSRRTNGDVTVPFDFKKAPLNVALERCDIKTGNGKTSNLFPSSIPQVNFSCQKTVFNKRPIGNLQLKLRPKSPEYVSLDEFIVRSPNYQIKVKGGWEYKNKRHSSSVKGTIHFVDVEKFLNAWGFRTDIADSDGNLNINFHWPRPLSGFGVRNLSGDMKVNMENGRIIEVEPGVGKFIGLLSFQKLHRRLLLDFSDVFSKGFTFDYLKGDLVLDNGIAYTSNLELDGTPAYIHIAGHSNLVRKTLDLQLKVSPHVTGSLPVAAAVATGNPAVGAVVWVVDQVLSPQINEITQYSYHVTGPWDKPVIR